MDDTKCDYAKANNPLQSDCILTSFFFFPPWMAVHSDTMNKERAIESFITAS